MPAKTISQLTQATTINGTDDFAIEQSGVTKRIAASVVRGDIVNANIKSDAAIAFSKLAPLNSAQILVGNGSNVPTAVSVTGDVTISNAGVTAIAAGAVVTADVADAAITPAKLSQPYTMATAQASTSGTNIDFTGIPTWAKRVTLFFSGVSTSGTSDKRIRLGVGGSFVTTGYVTSKAKCTTAAQSGSSTAGFEFMNEGQAAEVVSGQMVFTNVTGNTWVGSGQLATTSGNQPGALFSGGNIALSGALDSIRVTTVNGTDTFDAGTINIAYEG